MKKKTVATILQVLVTVGLLCWIFRDHKQNRDMWDTVHSDLLWRWIFAGLAAYGTVELLGATRWLVLLRVQGIYVSWFRLVKLLMIGIFFNQFLPGGTGGDVVKIYFLLKETPGKNTEAVLAVLMDRLVGLVGLIFVSGFVIISEWNWLMTGGPATVHLLYILLAILACTILGLITSFIITGLGLAQKLPAKFPKRHIFIDLSKAYHLYAHAWKPSLLAVIMSFAVHIFSFLSFYAAARAIHVKVPLLEFCAIMPIINTLTSLPVSVGGAGAREWLFATILPSLTTVTAAHAKVLSLLGYFIMVSWGVIGSVVYLLYRPSEHAKLSEIRKVVGGLEHDIAEGE